MNQIKAIIESLIFVSEMPLTVEKLLEVMGNEVSREDITTALDDLVREYAGRQGGVVLRKVAGGYHFRTAEECASWVKKLKAARATSLSRAALETLAVIAYRQPVLRSDIEKIRGVDASGALKGLLEKNLIRIVGRKDVPGRPIMYGTSRRFLEVFSLNDLSELPTMKDLEELEE
ncbi:MAG: SMC-Scp complex subunit ScpB [Deltaproteobacteria bacterium]|nr:SMC-Scp complex subunit ScpB [Deltaproteobacteria bacterium]